MATPIRTLSVHADYACRHSGACCTSGWRIPIERECEARLVRAHGAAVDELLERGGEMPAGATAVTRIASDHACVFYARGQAAGAGRCTIHRDLGHDALPEACRHFPRVCLVDARGVSITFSHYCPTAAAQLSRTDVPLAIVESPRSCPPGERWQGLDARAALPPLLRPGMLMDVASYGAWEADAVAALGKDEQRPDAALARLRENVERLRGWTPGAESLMDRVRAACAGLPAHVAAPPPALADEAWHALARGAVPPGLSFPPPPAALGTLSRDLVEPFLVEHHRPLRAYLASRLFASWVAYQGRGLRTIVASLHAALAIVRVEAARQCARRQRPLDRELLIEAVRQADLLLVHLADPGVLAHELSFVED